MGNQQEDEYNPKKQIENITATLEQPDKFAAVFCKALESQKTIDKALKEIIKTLIREDAETINALKKYLQEVAQDDWKMSLKRTGKFFWPIFMLVLGAVLQALSKKFL